MTPTQEKIVNAVSAANGEIGWSDLMNNLDYPEQQRALHEIRPLEKQGILHRLVVRDPDTGATVFTVKEGSR